MNELDFIDALSDRDTKRSSAAREFLGKLKTSGFSNEAIAAGLAGAGVVSGLAYLSMKPGRDGGKSKEQQFAASMMASNEAKKDQAERDNRPLTFREDITDAVAPAVHRAANVFAKHPGKGALLFAPTGAAAGVTGLRILKALLK